MQTRKLNATLAVVLLTVLSLWPAQIFAQKVVNVVTAGTLPTLYAGNDAELKLTGSINGTDAKYLRRLINDGALTALDLSEVKIVSGGEAYYDNLKTEDDVLGESMFSECGNLRSVVLPASITAIGKAAFSRTGLREIDIPSNVYRVGYDAFAYCSSLNKVVIGSRVATLEQGVFYSSAVRQAYVKRLTPPAISNYLFSSRPTVYVYTEAVDDYKETTWSDFATIAGGLEDYYPQDVNDADAVVNKIRDTYFEDAACTTLRAQYASMSDAQLTSALVDGGMPGYMVDIALKIKNGSWANYEKDFRIHSYKAYSDANYWNNLLMSTGGSYMGNPTGIYTAGFDSLYVFVDSDVPEDATLYIAGCVNNDLLSNAKSGQKLKKGLNVVEGQKGALFYIVYTADTRSQTKTLDQWPEIKIHIEGGMVNGYYDVSRKSDADYKALLKAATHDLFTVRSEHAIFNFKASTYRTVWPSTIDKSICWFDSLTVWEKELMGYCLSVSSGQRIGDPYCLTGGDGIFPIYYNNPNFAIEGKEADAGWANSSPYRTSYNSVACIRQSFDVSRADHDDWCAGHECGHNNQRAINLEGGTEASNNLFSNVVRYLTGRVTSSGPALSTVMDEFARHEPFVLRDISSMMRMYYQLYLYYHQARKNTSFYPELFKALREDPLTLWGSSYESQLKFVRKVCAVAQEDLTDFFTAWGFFEPFSSKTISDYGTHTVSSKALDILRTQVEIARYPVKNRSILFVEDRADYVLTNNMVTTAGQKRRDSDLVGQCGDLGQFTDYMDGHVTEGSYTYVQVDTLYSMSGKGGVGFLVLDADDKMLYASNARNFRIPASVGTDFKIYSVDADGTLHEAVKTEGGGAQTVWLDKSGTLRDSLSADVLKATVGGKVNSSDFKYLRELVNDGNLVAISLSDASIYGGGEAYYGSYTTSLNSIGSYLFSDFRKLIAIDLPESVTSIGSQAFARSGLKTVIIPDAVTSVGGDAFAYCDALTQVVVGAKVNNMGQGVFYTSPVKDAYVKALAPPKITSYLFSSNPTIHVYASALSAYQASSWASFGTIVGDLDQIEAQVSTFRYTVPASGIGTFSADIAITVPEWLTAYYTTSMVYSSDGPVMQMRRLEGKVPANTGVLLQGEAGATYTLTPNRGIDVEKPADNTLVAVVSAAKVEPTVTIDGIDYTNLALQNGAFHRIAAGSSNMQANKAYLQLPTSVVSSGVQGFRLVLEDDELTAVEVMPAVSAGAPKVVYDLSGRRVPTPADGRGLPSGIYVVNGNKVIVR